MPFAKVFAYMSKVGKKPIIIPPGVTVKLDGGLFSAQGKGGAVSLAVLPYTTVEIDGQTLIVRSNDQGKQGRANWGTMRALAQNAITGVNEGFSKELEIQGIGYRAQLNENSLVLNIGFSHPITFSVPSGVKVGVDKNFIKITGADKGLVGEVAAKIRALKKPEPYKGKGIRYRGEVVKQKAGKKVAGAAEAAS